MKRVFPIVVGLTLVFNSKSAIAGSLDRQLGVVVARENLVCLIASAPNLKTGSQVNIVLLSNPQRVTSGTISGSDRRCAKLSKPHDISKKYYRLSLPNRERLSEPAIGILNSNYPLHRVGSRVQGDLDNDGVEESFRACTSSEGVHLTVWSGKSLTGTRRWHGYYYLGYDLEPTCTESEVKMSALTEALQRISTWLEQDQLEFNGKKLSPLAPGLSYE